MDPSVWVVVVFLNGATYVGMDRFTDLEECKATGFRATVNTVMHFNCVPTKWSTDILKQDELEPEQEP